MSLIQRMSINYYIDQENNDESKVQVEKNNINVCGICGDSAKDHIESTPQETKKPQPHLRISLPRIDDQIMLDFEDHLLCHICYMNKLDLNSTEEKLQC